MLRIALAKEDFDSGVFNTDNSAGHGGGQRRTRPGGYVRAHGAIDLQTSVFDAVSELGKPFRDQQHKFDFALAGASALVVFGTIFNAFGLASYLFGVSRETMWTFWALGTGLWMFSLALWFLFLGDPPPKHRASR